MLQHHGDDNYIVRACVRARVRVCVRACVPDRPDMQFANFGEITGYHHRHHLHRESVLNG